MRTISCALLLACALVGGVRADDANAVKELLAKVTTAYGGAEKAAKLQAVTLKGKATASESGADITFSFDISVQGLDSIKMDAEVSAGGQTHRIIMVVHGDKGWAHNATENKTEEAPKEVVPMVRQFLTALRAASLPQGLNLKDIQLAHGGEGKVNDTEAVILRIARKEFNDITLYFDKKSGLPLKSETRVKEPTGTEFNLEFFYSNIKKIDGVPHPHRVKMTRDGKDLAEIEFSEIKLAQKFDASTFAKP